MPFASYDIIDSKDLAFLQDVLEDVCRERGILHGSEAHSRTADQLINWFLFGIRDRDELKSMLDPIIATPSLAAGS